MLSEFSKKQNREHYQKYKGTFKEYYRKNREGIIKKQSERNKTSEGRQKRRLYRQTLKGKYRRYKEGSKHRKIDFDLTLEEFQRFWKVPCNYCGGEIKTIGLDRMDSGIGYCLSNVVSCCIVCNKMKSEKNREEFLGLCKRIIENTSF